LRKVISGEREGAKLASGKILGQENGRTKYSLASGRFWAADFRKWD